MDASTRARVQRAGIGVLVVLGIAACWRAVSAPGVRAAFGNPVSPSPLRAEIVNLPVRLSSAGSVGEGGGLSYDSLMGRSGRVFVRLLLRDEVDLYPPLVARFGETAREPGIRSLDGEGAPFSFITLTPWREKLGGYLRTYRVGWWPGERKLMPSNYDNPDGFVEVTPENADTPLSVHFRLRQFLTHDQVDVWPKYVVLKEELLDKLELVLDALQGEGVPAQRVVILSGFRHPYYNQAGWGEGMAYASRHQYGDAADLIVDANGDGRMDDLNHDGVVDFHDTDVINRAVERVEWRYPELVGGLGLYHATGPSGPFAHIDVRGTRARWTNGASARRRGTTRYEYQVPGRSSLGTGKCAAEGAMAILCTGVR